MWGADTMLHLHRAMAENPIAGVLSSNPDLVMVGYVSWASCLTLLTCKEGIVKGIPRPGMGFPATER